MFLNDTELDSMGSNSVSFRAINIVTERSIIWLKKTTNCMEQKF